MSTKWRFTDTTNRIVSRTNDAGQLESVLVSAPSIQDWISAGNTPDPYIPSPEEIAAEAQAAVVAAAKLEAQADNIVQYLRDHTPAECAQYVQDNVTDLASAKAFLKKVAIVLCVLSKESLK